MGTYWLPLKDVVTGGMSQHYAVRWNRFSHTVCIIHDFNQLLKYQYFEVLVDHNAIIIYEKE